MKRWMDNWMNARIDVRMNGGMNEYYSQRETNYWNRYLSLLMRNVTN